MNFLLQNIRYKLQDDVYNLKHLPIRRKMLSFNEGHVPVIWKFSPTTQGIVHLLAMGVQVLISFDEPLAGFLQ